MKITRYGCFVVSFAVWGTAALGWNPFKPVPVVPDHVTTSPEFNPEKTKKLAIIVQDTTRSRSSAAVLRRIEDEFLHPLIQKGYSLAARSDIATVMDEIKFQQSGLTENDAAKLGRLLNVDAVLIVSINDMESRSEQVQVTYYEQVRVQGKNGKMKNQSQPRNGTRTENTARASIGARLIQAETGQILWLGDKTIARSVQSRDDAETILVPTAGIVAKAFPDRVPQKQPDTQ